jgi:hypothetical protein
LGSLEFAHFQSSIDCDGSIVKSLNQRWVSLLENNLRVALPSEGDPGEIGNLFSHVNVLSFWQICQTLVLAASGFSFFTRCAPTEKPSSDSLLRFCVLFAPICRRQMYGAGRVT